MKRGRLNILETGLILIGVIGIIITLYLNENLDIYYNSIIVIEMLIIFFVGFIIGNKYKRGEKR